MSDPLIQGQIIVSEVTVNTNQSLIQITEDRLRLRLMEHVSKVEKKKEWMAPFGIFFSIAITLLTTDFKDSFGLTKHTWSAIFLLTGAMSFVYFLWSVRAAWMSVSIDDLISCIKQGENRNSG